MAVNKPANQAVIFQKFASVLGFRVNGRQRDSMHIIYRFEKEKKKTKQNYKSRL